jgi:mono/diheme cytochrome c family protein
MFGSKIFFFALFLVWGMNSLAQAEEKLAETPGELLYLTHCGACHSEQIHWRKQKLATDWPSLKAQVRRWQAVIGLNWSEEEISDVAHYLNAIHYGFKVTEQKGISQGQKANQLLHQ